MSCRIIIYSEPLKTFTSAMPLRGMIPALVRLRPDDNFVFVTRSKKGASSILDNFFQELEGLPNWERVTLRRSERLMHIMALARMSEYCRVPVKGDVYLNTDIHFLGKKQRPQIALLADLSTLRRPERSSLNRIGIRIRQFSIRQMIRNADHIVAISKFTRNDLLEVAPEVADRSSVIYHGIDQSWFKNHTPTIQLDRPFWIWYGNMSRRKNLDGLFRAYSRLAELNRGIPDIWVVGKLGEDALHLPELIQTLGISGRIHHIPFQDLKTLIGIVGASEGLLFPSFYEGFGLPVVEAMAQGKPVLCSNVTALPEIAGGLGVLCAPEEETSLMEGLTALLSPYLFTPEKIQERIEWATQFQYEECALNYSKLIDHILQKEP